MMDAQVGQAMRDTFEKQQRKALELRYSTAAQRIALLDTLEAAVTARQDAICEAGRLDFQKPAAEVHLMEILPVIAEIKHTRRHLSRWMRPQSVRPTRSMLGTSSQIRREPRGVCLIIAPWNYPFNLALGPLVSAIAAGNTAIIKPSEMTPNMSAVIAELVREVFEPDYVAVFEGDHHASTALLELPFDHVFFTGSPQVGQIVMAAAARHLSSVTLELGGKSPVIIDQTADIAKAARSLCAGKFANAGQTCVAPDLIYVHSSVASALAGALKDKVVATYGATATEQIASPDYCRIVNERHFQRVADLHQDAVARGATVVIGGEVEAQQNFVAPTILTGVDPDAELMKEEIFGPLLPIIEYDDIDEPIRQINERPKPLALYVYSKDSQTVEHVLSRTSAGDSCVNQNTIHFAHYNLPFGGIGHSGFGSAHGEFGFRAFSHERSVLRDRASIVHWLYPPYTKRVKGLIRLTLERFT